MQPTKNLFDYLMQLLFSLLINKKFKIHLLLVLDCKEHLP